VKAFLTRYCVECHNREEAEGGLNLETYKGLQEGGEHGPVFKAGKPDDSRIVRLVEGKTRPKMPPRKATQPKAEELGLLRAWIAGGARDDSGAVTRLTLPDIKPKGPVVAPVMAVAYHPGGKVLAAGGRQTVYVLDAASGELKWK